MCVNKSAKATLRQIEKYCRDLDLRVIHRYDGIDLDQYLVNNRDNKFNIFPKFANMTSLMNMCFHYSSIGCSTFFISFKNKILNAYISELSLPQMIYAFRVPRCKIFSSSKYIPIQSISSFINILFLKNIFPSILLFKVFFPYQNSSL